VADMNIGAMQFRNEGPIFWAIFPKGRLFYIDMADIKQEASNHQKNGRFQ